MQLCQNLANTVLNAVNSTVASGSMVIFDNAIPATVEAAVSTTGNAATFPYTATPFSAAAFSGGYAHSTASFTTPTVTSAVTATTTASYAADFNSSGVPQHLFSVGGPWAASTAVLAGLYVTSAGNSYRYTTAGTTGTTAPSGTSTSPIADGTAAYVYVGPGQQFDIALASIVITPNEQVSLVFADQEAGS